MTTAIEQLEKLYAQLPKLACQGKCQTCCGPIEMSVVEQIRLRAQGVDIPPMTDERVDDWAANKKFGRDGKPLWCPALNLTTGGCDVYDVRPMVCRLWGAAESMPCPHGCKPTEMLTDAEAMDFLIRSFAIGGHPRLQGMDEEARRNMAQIMENPITGPLMARIMRGDTDARQELEAILDTGEI